MLIIITIIEKLIIEKIVTFVRWCYRFAFI